MTKTMPEPDPPPATQERELFSTDHLMDDESRAASQFSQQLFTMAPHIFVVPVLIAINVAVFVAMRANGVAVNDPDAGTLLPWGAMYGPLITHGEWWRLLTAAFLHAGVAHIFFNMLLLWQGGSLTERLFGHVSFTVLYLLSAIGGSLTSMAWHPMVIGVGASGAVFGVYGALAAFTMRHWRTLPRSIATGLASSAATLVFGNLVYGLFQEHVDVAAHVGGLLTGFVVGLALARPISAAPIKVTLLRPAAVALLGLLLATGAAASLPVVDDVRASLEQLAALEKTTAERYNESVAKLEAQEIDKTAFADFLEHDILPQWNAMRDSITHLKVPATEADRLTATAAYMATRVEAWQLRAQALRTNDVALMEQSNDKEGEALELGKRMIPPSARRTRAVPAATMNVVVRDGRGQPLPSARVTITCLDKRLNSAPVARNYWDGCKTPRSSQTDAQGRATFVALPGGTYVATTQARAFNSDEHTLELTGDQTLSIRLTPSVDLQAEVIRIQTLEKDTISAYERALSQLKAQKIKDSQFADTVEALLPRWHDERLAIEKLVVPEAQQAGVKRIADYMALREEGWELTARGVRANDSALVKRANQKHQAAMTLMSAPPDK